MKKFPAFFLGLILFLSLSANAAPPQISGDELASNTSNTLRRLTAYSTVKPKASVTLNNTNHEPSGLFTDRRNKDVVNRVKEQAASVKAYAKANQFSTEYCFLVDMSIPSGKNRFFIYNLKKDTVEYSSLVAHGMGSDIPGTDQLQFSNAPNSFKTSLGKYKIGHSYVGTYGLAFKLYGLDTTNSKAYERAIVLHSYTRVPDAETYPGNICESAGCPMVSPAFLSILSKYITSSTKPVLMWIYN